MVGAIIVSAEGSRHVRFFTVWSLLICVSFVLHWYGVSFCSGPLAKCRLYALVSLWHFAIFFFTAAVIMCHLIYYYNWLIDWLIANNVCCNSIVYWTAGAVTVWLQWQGQLDRSVTTRVEWHLRQAWMPPAGIRCAHLLAMYLEYRSATVCRALYITSWKLMLPLRRIKHVMITTANKPGFTCR